MAVKIEIIKLFKTDLNKWVNDFTVNDVLTHLPETISGLRIIDYDVEVVLHNMRFTGYPLSYNEEKKTFRYSNIPKKPIIPIQSGFPD